MLFDSERHLGVSQEGTIDNPIAVLGCTVERFANFLGWFNYKCVCSLLMIVPLILITDEKF